mgnify:CR=1 FL=1
MMLVIGKEESFSSNNIDLTIFISDLQHIEELIGISIPQVIL